MQAADKELIGRILPGIDPLAWQKLEACSGIYAEFNARLNLISRKDMEAFDEHHLMHSLSIAHWNTAVAGNLMQGKRVLDAGTGGGFPGIPLAILMPNTEFVLMDSIRKKMDAVQAIAGELGLQNIQVRVGRVEEFSGRSFDMVTARAVTRLQRFCQWTLPLLGSAKRAGNRTWTRILYLKGGDLNNGLGQEIREVQGLRVQAHGLKDWWGREWFTEKYLLELIPLP